MTILPLGSHTEVQYRLMSFGIPIDVLPISSEGEIKTQWQKKWLAARFKKEMNMEKHGHNFGRIDFPTNQDVLLGKGRPIQKHSGNVHLRNLVNVHTAAYYFATSKASKSQLTWKIVKDLQKAGGRFLIKDKEDCWVVASDKDARDKVGKLFMTSQAAFKQKGTVSMVKEDPRPVVGDGAGARDGGLFVEPSSKRQRICFHICGST